MLKPKSTRGIKIALTGYAIILVIQLGAYLFTHYLVLLAMSFETIASILAAALFLLTISFSNKPANNIYMLGYERAQNIAALITAVVFISVMTVETFRQALPRLSLNEAVIDNSILPIIVSIASIVIATIPIFPLLRERFQGASVRAQLYSSIEDIFAYSSGLASTILVAKGYFIADPIFSMVIGFFIGLMEMFLIIENVRFLLGRGPNHDFVMKIEEAVRSVEGVTSLHSFKAEYVGPDTLFASFRVTVPKGTSLEEAKRIVSEVKQKVGEHADCQHCIVEVEPDN